MSVAASKRRSICTPKDSARRPPLPSEQQQKQQQQQQRLPVDVIVHTLGFLRPSDKRGHLTLSKDVRRTLLCSWSHVHATWDFDRKVKALARLLLQMPNLKFLGLTFLADEHKLWLLRALGSVPAALPALEELDVSPGDDNEECGDKVAKAVVKFLERRRSLGLRPLVLSGTWAFDAATMRRVWACTPPEVVVNLSASGGPQVEALAEYMKGGADFASLRWLRLDVAPEESMAWESEEEEEEEPVDVDISEIVMVLIRGGAPMLEGLCLIGFEQPPLMKELGGAMACGHLPKLSGLIMEKCTIGANDFSCLMTGMCASHTPLRYLHLDEGELDADALATFALLFQKGGLKTGRGFSRLEDLRLRGSLLGDAALYALASGAPCAQTLTSLYISGTGVSSEFASAFFGGLGRGDLPCLTDLTLRCEALGNDTMAQLAQALLDLAARGTPARLKKLWLTDTAMDVACLDLLTPVFAASGLPQLSCLSIRGDDNSASAVDTRFVEAWAALGTKIKLQSLMLYISASEAVKARFHKAVGDPSFCPFLTGKPTGIGDYEEKTTQWEQRRRKIEEDGK